MPGTLGLNEEVVSSIVTDIWMSLFGEEPRPGACTGIVEGVTAHVEIDVSPSLRVTVAAAHGSAEAMAAALFATSTPTDEDVHDTLGELANMVGGNVKACLDQDASLSLPVTSRGACGELLDEGLQWDGCWKGDPVRVVVQRVTE